MQHAIDIGIHVAIQFLSTTYTVVIIHLMRGGSSLQRKCARNPKVEKFSNSVCVFAQVT